MTVDPTRHQRFDEKEEADEAKEKADPAVEDPAFMPNIIPQRRPEPITTSAAVNLPPIR